MVAPIKVVLADDHPIVRKGLREMIAADPALHVVAEAADGKAALALIEQHEPDVAVLDIDMPEADGFAVVRALRSRRLKTEFIFLTMHTAKEIFEEAMAFEIKGYVLKDSAETDIVTSIKSVAAGRPYLSPGLSAHLLERQRTVAKFDQEHPELAALTPTERHVLKLVAGDRSSKEIAAQLGISVRTVETHRTNVCGKLKLQGPLALVRFALTHKLKL